MPLALSALWRGTRTLGIVLLGLAAASAAYLWWGIANAALLAIIGCLGSAVALGLLYDTRRPLRFKSVPLTLGYLALFAVYAVGVIAARDVAMTLVGTDTDATVARTWTTGGTKGKPQHRCTLHHPDGTPIPRELGTNCEGHSVGDTIPIVLDPAGHFAPISGPKSDMDTVGELQVTATAGFVLLLSIALGTPPKRARQ
ncbi:hypothetical protein [Actinomadura sp. BRA 177]|uniref:hypothetical protein n=1 Tax=Actinomadura sp. BRA 177 TaxID=2745202 RepID=UPI0015955028|nr:hypothetical protein [Actinomadura sp. BRA 177]NVI85923.1 hypothetical protein [Actinomadura sp. BRA 177]